MQVLKKLEVELPYHLVIPFLDVYPKELVSEFKEIFAEAS